MWPCRYAGDIWEAGSVNLHSFLIFPLLPDVEELLKISSHDP